MRIAVDAMGSDNHPGPDVAGAVAAARAFGDEMILVGDEAQISAELTHHDTAGLPLHIQHAPQAVSMHDKPSDIVKGKPQSSMHVGMKLVKDGAADAFVSAGNTGAILSVAMFGGLGRIRAGQRIRPALGILFPTPSNPLLIDGGANADVRVEHLLQFALMGSVYAKCLNGVAAPRVGLLSNGEEEGKGTQLIRDAIPLLEASGLNYVGSVEPKEFFSGAVEVGVTDGFTGNIMIKSAEAVASVMINAIRDQLQSSTRAKLGGLLAKPALKNVAQMLNPDEVGGQPLLGVNGVVIIGHGRSNAYAVRQAIGQARKMVSSGVVGAIRDEFARLALENSG